MHAPNFHTQSKATPERYPKAIFLVVQGETGDKMYLKRENYPGMIEGCPA